MISKICATCNETKPLDQFSKDKTRPDGSKRRCRACDKAYQAAYRAKNREQVNAKHAVYNAEHRDEAAAYKQTPKGRYGTYKTSAKTRAISFDLTMEEFLTYWQADCSYCKRPIPTVGIDRIDSDIGYTLANCVPCCTICNLMKSDHSLEDWQTNMLMALKGMGVI